MLTREERERERGKEEGEGSRGRRERGRKGAIKEASDGDHWTPYVCTHVYLSTYKHVHTHKLESYEKGHLPVHQ